MKELFAPVVDHKCSGICAVDPCSMELAIEFIEKRKPDFEDIFINNFLHRYARFNTYRSTFVYPDLCPTQVTDKFIFASNKILYLTYSVEYDGWNIKKTYWEYREGKVE